jgi:hypothetical protein
MCSHSKITGPATVGIISAAIISLTAIDATNASRTITPKINLQTTNTSLPLMKRLPNPYDSDEDHAQTPNRNQPPQPIGVESPTTNSIDHDDNFVDHGDNFNAEPPRTNSQTLLPDTNSDEDGDGEDFSQFLDIDLNVEPPLQKTTRSERLREASDDELESRDETPPDTQQTAPPQPPSRQKPDAPQQQKPHPPTPDTQTTAKSSQPPSARTPPKTPKDPRPGKSQQESQNQTEKPPPATQEDRPSHKTTPHSNLSGDFTLWPAKPLITGPATNTPNDPSINEEENTSSRDIPQTNPPPQGTPSQELEPYHQYMETPLPGPVNVNHDGGVRPQTLTRELPDASGDSSLLEAGTAAAQPQKHRKPEEIIAAIYSELAKAQKKQQETGTPFTANQVLAAAAATHVTQTRENPAYSAVIAAVDAAADAQPQKPPKQRKPQKHRAPEQIIAAIYSELAKAKEKQQETGTRFTANQVFTAAGADVTDAPENPAYAEVIAAVNAAADAQPPRPPNQRSTGQIITAIYSALAEAQESGTSFTADQVLQAAGVTDINQLRQNTAYIQVLYELQAAVSAAQPK